MDDAPIAAISTAPGPAAVSIVRISGTGSIAIADKLIPANRKKISARASGTFFHTPIIDTVTGETIDDAIVLVFRAPHSFTGEEAVEIQGHGGALPAQRILNALLSAGAKPAPPGEFTRRAFINGKLDLTQAEAIASFIAAKSETAANIARSQLDGALGKFFSSLHDALLSICADIEHLLDFTEEETPNGWIDERKDKLFEIIDRMVLKAETWSEGRILSSGALVVLGGKPNAGKSSLMNALLGENRAIVNATPGTTRDAIEEDANICGIAVRLVDTAGLRETPDEIEREGVARARAAIAKADLTLLLIAPDDTPPVAVPEHTLLVYTKADLRSSLPEGLNISAKTGLGIEELKKAIVNALGINPESFGAPIVSLRQKEELQAAILSAKAAEETLAQGEENLVPAAFHLSRAAQAIGRIIGRVYSDDLLDAVFSKFCVGK